LTREAHILIVLHFDRRDSRHEHGETNGHRHDACLKCVDLAFIGERVVTTDIHPNDNPVAR